MSTTVKTGWLNNKSGEFFAPKTLISQVQTGDGILLEDKIQQDLNEFKNRFMDGELSNYETKEEAEEAYADISTLLSNKIPFDNTNAVSLNSGDDLNNFKTPGIYISGDSSVSSTLVNAPVTGSGFKLFVIDGYINGRVSQFVTTNNNNLHYRQFNGTTWHIWNTLATKSGLDTKQEIITGAATTITDSNLTASRALVSNASGKVGVSAVTSTELGYLDGVTSAIQTQFNNITSNYATKTSLGRTTAVNAADTNYATYMARGIAAGTDDLTAGVSLLTSGCLYFVYE